MRVRIHPWLIRILTAAAAAAVLACGSRAIYLFGYKYHRYDDLILRTAKAEGIDPSLVWTVIWRESRFTPDRIGKAGEIGLMQVSRDAAMEWGRASHAAGFSAAGLIEPSTNVAAGTWYLARALARWAEKDDPVPYALAEYNAGHSNARRWAAEDGSRADAFLRRITYPSTRRYVDDILSHYRRRF